MPFPPQQSGSWLTFHAGQQRARRAQSQAVHDAEVVRRSRQRGHLVELLPRDGSEPQRSPVVPLMPALRRELAPDDALTAPITRDLPVQRDEAWAWWQVAWAGLLWLLLAAALIAGVVLALALAGFAGLALVLAVMWAGQWVPPPVLVVGVLAGVAAVVALRVRAGGS